MKKILSIFLIGFIAVGIFVPTHFANAAGFADVLDYVTGAGLSPILLPIIVLITTLCSFLLIITGQLLDLIVQWSIFDMSSIIGSGSAIGGAVLDSWGAIRDLANIFFIFVLLYAAFSAMFNFSFGSFGKTVVNIIIVALLINFSMFFTKVVIDASNVVTTGFYQIISESNKEVVVNNQVQGNIMGIGSGRYTNLSAAFMRVLNIQTVFGTFDVSMFRSTRMIIYGIFGSSIMLILALILFSIAMMLITRFIVLLYLMILSPAAILCIALPKLRGYFDKWLSSLLSQAYFAPVFFALLWIALRIGSEVNVAIRAGSTGKFEFTNIMSEDPTSGVAVLFSYILILGMTLAAMRAAKSIASSAAGFSAINKYTTSITAATGAWAGRRTFGWAGDKLASNTNLQTSALKDTGFKGGVARAVMYGAKAAQNSSFDIRNAKLPTGMIGDAIEGTVGRTKAGKWLNLNDVKISDAEVAGFAGADLGKGESKGFKEIKDESRKRVREEDTANRNQLKQLEWKEKVLAGAKADPVKDKSTVDEMQRIISTVNDSQFATLVETNRQLLDSLNFANAISWKQLEAINKSDKFTDEEKDKIKNKRFEEIKYISDPVAIAAIKKPAFARTADENKALVKLNKAKERVKGLADVELELINPTYLDSDTDEGKEFIAALRTGQVDTILNNKSGKFTSTQREMVRNERMRPIKDAIGSGNVASIEKAVKPLDFKTMIKLLRIDGGNNTAPNNKIAMDTRVLPLYTVKKLRKMAESDDMSDVDVDTLRKELEIHGNPAVKTWLADPNTGGREFPAL